MAEQSLFGTTPEALQASRDAALRQQASQYAQLDPFQRASMNLYQGGNRLGGAIGGLLGAQDPELQRSSMLKKLATEFDTTSADGLLGFAKAAAQAGMPEQAMQAAQQAQAMKLQEAQVGKTLGEQKKLDLAAQQEVSLRDALSKLPVNATQEQILAVVTQYGSPDKVLAVIQGASDKEAARAQAVTLAQQAADAKVEAARLAGESRETVARIMAESRRDVAQLVAALKQSANANKPLPASLQKEEGADLTAIDTYGSQQAALAPAIASLTPNAQGATKLELGPVKNAIYMAQNASGNSTPESRAYEGLRSAVDTAVNLQVSAEKGVQTDKDVVRFAQALVAAYGKNDTKATLEALTRYRDSLSKAAEKTQGRVESRRKSQNVEPYGFTSKPSSALGTPGNPIKLD